VNTVAGSDIRSDAPIRQTLQELSVPVRRVGPPPILVLVLAAEGDFLRAGEAGSGNRHLSFPPPGDWSG